MTGSTTFSLNDLLNPTPKRTQRFLSVLQNFWTFCNSINDKVMEVQDHIDGLLNEKKKEESTLDDYRNRINQVKSKAVEEAETVKILEMENEDLKKKSQELLAEKEELCPFLRFPPFVRGGFTHLVSLEDLGLMKKSSS